MDKLAPVADAVARAQITLDESPGMSLADLRVRARRLAGQLPLALIVVDYLQLMTADTARKFETRQAEVAELSRGIKALARELAVPILTVSQLNRNADTESGTPPHLAHLRESDAIEQDADVVMFLCPIPQTQGRTRLILAKNRNGPTGTIDLIFLKDCQRFEALEDHQDA